VRITDGAIVAAATLSNRYITDRFLPDKAIDLMDEAGSRLRMQVDSKPEELDELDRQGCAVLGLWKLDVEGYELEALAGAARSLAAGRIRAVYLEIGQFGAESIALLRAHGYTPWRLRDSGRPEPLQSHTSMENALFLAPGHPSVPSP